MIKVTAAVIEKDGKILIAKRKRSDRLGGRWEFPGGKIHIGETPEACLKRELREELGIDAEIGEFICSSRFRYMAVPLELLVFRVRSFSGEMAAAAHDDIRWVEPLEMAKYRFVPADVSVVKRLTEGAHGI